MTFNVLFAPYAPFGVAQAPLFIWLAVVGLVVGTLVVFMRLQSLVRREQHLYQRIARDMRTIEAMNCLTRESHQAVVQRCQGWRAGACPVIAMKETIEVRSYSVMPVDGVAMR